MKYHVNLEGEKVIKYGPDDPDLWYPPTDWIDYSSTSIFSDEMSEFNKYIYYFYYSFLFFTLNEIGPTNVVQMYICIASLILSVIIYPIIVGDMIMLITKLQKEDTIQQMKLD